jgi:hypothetical protein
LRVVIAILIAVSLDGCAAGSQSLGHGVVTFPSPERETCSPNSTQLAQLSVFVGDRNGDSLPGAAVYLASMADSSARPISAISNSHGIAVLEAPVPGDYALTAVIAGFAPQARGLRLRTGCVGSTTFALDVGPTIVEGQPRP